jgi:hypothetical protein
MTRLGLGLAGLLTGALLSSVIGACCPSPTPISAGVHLPGDQLAEADHRLTISQDLSVVTETFTRNGVAWEIDYAASKPMVLNLVTEHP